MQVSLEQCPGNKKIWHTLGNAGGYKIGSARAEQNVTFALNVHFIVKTFVSELPVIASYLCLTLNLFTHLLHLRNMFAIFYLKPCSRHLLMCALACV